MGSSSSSTRQISEDQSLPNCEQDNELLALCGPYLVSSDNTKRNTSQVISANQIIGVFLAADWCGECHGFAKKLFQVYKEVNKDEKKFEIILCSIEKTEESFREHFEGMPCLAIPFEANELRDNLGSTLWLRGVPKLILFERNGIILTKNGRNVISQQGAASFPWLQFRQL